MYLAESINTRDVSDLLEAETARVNELLADGTLAGCWVKSDYSGAFLLIDRSDEAATTAVLDTFPLAMNGAARFELTAVTPLDSSG